MEVMSPPSDTVSDMTYGLLQNQFFLTAGSWDGTVSVWSIDDRGNANAEFRFEHQAPVLSVTQMDGVVYSAGCDQIIRGWDLTSQQAAELGAHDAPIQVIRAIEEISSLATVSWDATFRLTDIRNPAQPQVVQLPEKPVAMDAKSNLLVVAYGERGLAQFDLRNPSQPVETLVSSHELITSCVGIAHDLSGYSYGSVEGRVHINYLSNRANSFPFRCHRINQQGQPSECYGVTCVTYNPQTGHLATTGGDGTFVFWDHLKKTRIRPSDRTDNTITWGCFSPDARFFTYAVSYDWSKGANSELRNKPHRIFTHVMTQQDTTINRR